MENNEGQSLTEQAHATGPGERWSSFGPEEWKYWLSTEEDIGTFNGHIDSASTMIHELALVVQDVQSKLTQKGIKEFKLPQIVVIYKGENALKTPIIYAEAAKAIAIKKSYLERFSNLSMTDIYEILRSDGELAYIGTIPNMMRLGGIEECHHAAYIKFKGDTGGANPLSVTMSEYDARDDEYRVLGWQIRHAIQNGFPDVTTARLRDRQSNAREIRLQNINNLTE